MKVIFPLLSVDDAEIAELSPANPKAIAFQTYKSPDIARVLLHSPIVEFLAEHFKNPYSISAETVHGVLLPKSGSWIAYPTVIDPKIYYSRCLVYRDRLGQHRHVRVFTDHADAAQDNAKIHTLLSTLRLPD